MQIKLIAILDECADTGGSWADEMDTLPTGRKSYFTLTRVGVFEGSADLFDLFFGGDVFF